MNEVFKRTRFAGELLLENPWWPGSFWMPSSIHGLHLPRSLSAEYANRTRGHHSVPQPSGSFWDRYPAAMDHAGQIDQHDAFTDPGIVRIFDRIEPSCVTYEFTYASRAEWVEKIHRQNVALSSLPAKSGRKNRKQ